MKDAVESAAIAHKKAADRHAAAQAALARIGEEENALLSRERSQTEQEKKEILEKALQESGRLREEAERLSIVEQEEALDRVKEQFLELVVKETEESLKRGLKQADHHEIFRRAQNSIELGV
jgi:hypothetical protein